MLDHDGLLFFLTTKVQWSKIIYLKLNTFCHHFKPDVGLRPPISRLRQAARPKPMREALSWIDPTKPPYGYGSIPIDTFLVGWTSIYQLFWGSLDTRVLTHPHIHHTEWIWSYPAILITLHRGEKRDWNHGDVHSRCGIWIMCWDQTSKSRVLHCITKLCWKSEKIVGVKSNQQTWYLYRGNSAMQGPNYSLKKSIFEAKCNKSSLNRRGRSVFSQEPSANWFVVGHASI